MTQQELEARITALEAKIRTLEEIEEIKRLMWSYSYLVDYGELDKVMDNYVDDAIMEYEVRGGLVSGLEEGTLAAIERRYEGKEAIEGVYRSVLPQNDRFVTAHLISNPVVTVEGERAKGTFYLLCPSRRERAMWGQGRYDMEYVKVDGKWKISSFKFSWNFRTPYDEGWGKTLMVDVR